MWEPDEPMVLLSNFSDSAWSNIDVSEAVSPVTASGVFLTVKPTGGSVSPVKCAVKSSVDELLIESFSDQYNPYLLKLEPGDTSVDIRFIEGNRPVEILARGYLEFR
jgi:hypothetical protein